MIYDVVDDPSSALPPSWGSLWAAVASRKPFEEGAAIRRNMASAEKDKLGTIKKKLEHHYRRAEDVFNLGNCYSFSFVC